VTEIKNRFLRSDVTALRNISVATIDSFQGQENDIILISLVRSSKSGKIGHLSSSNRLCVAISRARCGLYLFGNDAQLSKASKIWKKVTEAMWKRRCLGDRFPFRSSSQFKSQGEAEDQMEGRSPGKEPQTMFVGKKGLSVLSPR
ncbi:helicase required for RNAi-mediated heterochromatin assembly 1-like, partial [Orbicella faveolata]|uniref:helicase required for RNAi-mediated heterochromatin assembly 1-like n=1 Tax=Orbicella faveolata TaxID=48498 RepID=UPI0009E271BA